MSIIIFEGYWTRKDVTRNSHCLFVFGDNDIEKGKGGQAIIRGLKNTAGIPTKKYPSNWKSSFYTDDEYKENCQKIKDAIELIKKRVHEEKYEYIVLPKDGFGTGLSQLPKKAPKTYKFVCKQVKKLIKEFS